MLRFRSPYLTSQRIPHGRTPWRWMAFGWAAFLFLFLPLAWTCAGVHYEWFDLSSWLYAAHDEVYLPLRGWLWVKPWPYCLVVYGFLFLWIFAAAATFLAGRSPCKRPYIGLVRIILFAFSRLPAYAPPRFLNAWRRWAQSRHDLWPLLADEMRTRAMRRFDARPQQRKRRLGEVIRWTVLTIRLRCWLSPAGELSRAERMQNARAWIGAVIRLAAVKSFVSVETNPSGQLSAHGSSWRDVFRRDGGAWRERIALASELLRQSLPAEQCVAWLQQEAAHCATEEILGRPVSEAANFPYAAGFDFDSAAEDLVRLAQALPELASLDAQEEDESPAKEHEPPVKEEPPAAQSANAFAEEARQALRRLTISTLQRRRFVEESLVELERRAFHAFAPAERPSPASLEQEPQAAALCVELALASSLFLESGELTNGLLDAIDAFHFVANLNEQDEQDGEGTELQRTLAAAVGDDVRRYCRELHACRAAEASRDAAEFLAGESSLIRPEDLEIFHDRAALIDRAANLR